MHPPLAAHSPTAPAHKHSHAHLPPPPADPPAAHPPPSPHPPARPSSHSPRWCSRFRSSYRSSESADYPDRPDTSAQISDRTQRNTDPRILPVSHPHHLHRILSRP